LRTTPDPLALRIMAGEDALRELCFSDALFRDRYDGWCVLGHGSHATVVRTHSRDAGRDVALKIFVNLGPEVLDRVRQEVRASQPLSSSYVIDTHSLFDRGGLAWFEMELVNGPNLQAYLRRHETAGVRVALDEGLDIALAIARAVWQAHRQGVIHRDLKPSNILVPDSGRPTAKVGDFGIARLVGAELVTPRGTVTGTPRFASPEALAGHHVGTPHDVYGLGMTLFALFTGGHLPHQVPPDVSLRALRHLYRTKPPAPIESLSPGIDPRLARLITRCLAARPSRRPTMSTIVTTLEAVRLMSPPPAVAARAPSGLKWVLGVAAAAGIALTSLWRRARRVPERRDGQP